MSLRCLIVDDNARFRDELGGLLEEQGLEILGRVASGDEAVRLVVELRPDVVLADIDLGAESGFELARRLRGVTGAGAPNVILISTHDEREYADLIDASPAMGFLSKTELTASAIRRILGTAGGSDDEGPSPSDERRGT